MCLYTFDGFQDCMLSIFMPMIFRFGTVSHASLEGQAPPPPPPMRTLGGGGGGGGAIAPPAPLPPCSVAPELNVVHKDATVS